jgi:hypothetical protein
MSRFEAGVSGNPSGRPKGTVKTSAKTDTLREALLAYAPGILNELVKAAKAGDIQAAKLVLERCIPALKPTEPPIQFDGINEALTLIQQGEAVLAAIADGHITPGQGQTMMNALTAQARLIETGELLERVATLERTMVNK